MQLQWNSNDTYMEFQCMEVQREGQWNSNGIKSNGIPMEYVRNSIDMFIDNLISNNNKMPNNLLCHTM